MNSRERILATLRGEERDHAPMWLRDEFNLTERFDSYLRPDQYRSIGSGLEYDEFTDSWITRDANRDRILERYREVGGDAIIECKPPGNVCNRFLVIPPQTIHQTSVGYDRDFRIEKYAIATPKGDLTFTVKFQKDVSTQWITEEPIKETEDLRKIMSIPWSRPELDLSSYRTEVQRLGNDGVTMMQIDTPVVTVSGMMNFQDYLMLTITDTGLLRELCDMAYERISTIVDSCLDAGMGPIYRFNGSEQSTPPMNSVTTYEQFIYEYERRLVDQVHKRGALAAVHCHGHVREILPYIVQMGVDMLDPIEAPPSGNVEFTEACRIAGNHVALAGNIQLRDLQSLAPKEIAAQVDALLDAAEGYRFILDTSASPITTIDERTRENYLAMINAWARRGAS